MPFMEARDLQLMTSAITSRDNKIDAKNRVIEKLQASNKYMVVGEAALGAGAFGFLRGWYEDPTTGAWNIPHTTFDIELATILGLTGAALLGVYYKGFAPYAQHAANASAGITGHYVGQLARKAARTRKATGKWARPSMIAGVPGIGELPQYDPTSYDPTQYSAPYDDAVASALGSSGV
jgi:hypothetical protein